MAKHNSFAAAMGALAALFTCSTAVADRYSELANTPFVENAATDASAKKLMEELYFQRATQAYLWALPAMNTVAMRRQRQGIWVRLQCDADLEEASRCENPGDDAEFGRHLCNGVSRS